MQDIIVHPHALKHGLSVEAIEEDRAEKTAE